MKKIYALFFAVMLMAGVAAQAPSKMSYQAVVRNSSNQLVTNHAVSIRVSILKGSAAGTSIYTETRNTVTNANGLVSIEIGGGEGFDAINWADGPYFIKTETDPDGGTTYTITGTNQILAVPYALHSKTAEALSTGIIETDPVFGVSAAKGITSAYISSWNTAFGWGNHAGLYRPVSYVPAWNEITSNPFAFSSPASNQLLKYNSASGKWENWTPNFLTGFTETDPLWTAASANYYTKANLQTSGASQLHFNNLTNKPTTVAGYGITDAHDNWGTQTVVTDATLSGNGSAASPLKIAQHSATTGQVLKWNGTTWVPQDDATGTETLALPWSGSSSTGNDNYAFTVISTGMDIGAIRGKQTNTSVSSGGNGVYGESASPFGSGVYGKSTGTYGVGTYGEGYIGMKARGDVKGIYANSAGTGVEGRSTSMTGYGLAGYSPNCGVYGETWNTRGYGVYGKSTGGDLYEDITCGVYGEANTEHAYGVKGFVSDSMGANYGVYGESKSDNGYGVYGTSKGFGVSGQATGKFGTGVYGKSGGFQGIAVFGEATADNSIGIKGLAFTSNSTGVYGEGAKQGIYGISANYGIYGTSTGYKGKAVIGEATGTNSIAIQGTATNSNSTGVWGEGDNQGVYGVSASSDGMGVYGSASGTTGDNFGMYGESLSSAGTGVYGKAPLYGIYGISSGANSFGVYGKTTSGTGYGVYGEAQKIGVYGVSSSATGSGVYGEALKYGIYGFATAAAGYGVYGLSSSTSGYGVYGESPRYGAYAKSTGATGRGVVGEATGTGSIGVWGIALGDNSTGVYGQGANYDFYAAGPGVNYGEASSIRWKKNIEPIPDPLGKVQAIRGVYFDWDTGHGSRHDVGMIAEEVGKVLPEIVVYEENGIDASGMDYSKITPLLVEAIKALISENDRLKLENEQISKRLEKLENSIETSMRK